MRVVATARGYIGGRIVEPGEEIEVDQDQFSSYWMRKPSEPIAPGSQEGQRLKQAEAAKRAAEPKVLADALKEATPVPVPVETVVELYKSGSK